ncbi:nucleotidyltransferase family protein [Candidatus Woesearchaeota archaeon]|nr:nucleotidyltransferase family protein [Candidatus Woesearchaeota archaeon]
MKKTAVIQSLKKKIIPVLKKNEVARAGIFGSYARGDYTKRSDIDILIQFKKRKSLFDLAHLELELEEKLNKKVEVITYKSICPLVKDRILNEEVKLL